MKKIIIYLVCLFGAINGFSQAKTPEGHSFNHVTISTDSAKLGGYDFKTEAVFECMIWNVRTKTITVQWRFDVIGKDGTTATTKNIEQSITDNFLVYSETGEAVSEPLLVVTDSATGAMTYNKKVVVGQYTYYTAKGGPTLAEIVAEAMKRKEIFKLK